MARNVIANLIRSLWPEAHVDRWGRLKGNFLAASHAMLGRIEPEYILKIGCSGSVPSAARRKLQSGKPV